MKDSSKKIWLAFFLGLFLGLFICDCVRDVEENKTINKKQESVIVKDTID